MTGSCDTVRTDRKFEDGWDCDGSYLAWPTDNHLGWTSSATGDSRNGYVKGEDDFRIDYGPKKCQYLPVWCCSELN